MRRGAFVAGTAVLALLAAPGAASADVIFDPADADSLAATLADAYDKQGVCYGWQVSVNNVGVEQTSVGSNFGAGQELASASQVSSCDARVEFQASITWTSEYSESEDSARYSVSGPPDGPSTADLNSLEIISEEGLVGDNVDVDVYKAVSALPLLAADAGLAEPIEASPAPTSIAAADGGQPTGSPGSDFWRQAGGAIMFAVVLLLAAGVFAIWAIKTRRPAHGPTARRGRPPHVPEHVPPEWTGTRPYPPRTEPGRGASAGPADPARRPDDTPPGDTNPETRPER